VNKEPQAREKFLVFSEAYAVLGDDRQRYVSFLLHSFHPSPLLRSGSRVNGRRSYDRFLAASGGQQSVYHQPHPHPTYSHYATANEARRRSANYAWERRRRPPPGSNPHVHHYQHHPHPRSQTSSSSASSDLHSRRPTAGTTPHYRPPRTDWKETELDRVNRVSGLGRAMQLVFGIFVSIAFVGTMGKS
jgi:hypothetical protein